MQPCIEYKSLTTLPKRDAFYQFRPEHPMYAPKKIGELYFIKAKDWITTIYGVIRETFDNTRQMVAGMARHYTIHELN